MLCCRLLESVNNKHETTQDLQRFPPDFFLEQLSGEVEREHLISRKATRLMISLRKERPETTGRNRRPEKFFKKAFN